METTLLGTPVGAIIMGLGDGSNIPDGWALANGENGTVDLREVFYVEGEYPTQGFPVDEDGRPSAGWYWMQRIA